MANGISDYLENELLDQVFKNAAAPAVTAVYVSLHTADPGDTGASEVTGGSYIRKVATFDVAASGATANSGNITWTGMPAVTVTHVACWDAESSGNCLWSGALTAQKVLNSGDSFQINTGDLDVTLD